MYNGVVPRSKSYTSKSRGLMMLKQKSLNIKNCKFGESMEHVDCH